MSYSIQVYPIELREKTDAAQMDYGEVMNFVEKEHNLVSFTQEQLQLIEEHLEYRKYKLKKKSKDRKDFTHAKYPSVSVMFTPTGLYFDARGDDVFEITMTSGEFGYSGSLKGKFGVFDSQNKGWQNN